MKTRKEICDYHAKWRAKNREKIRENAKKWYYRQSDAKRNRIRKRAAAYGRESRAIPVYGAYKNELARLKRNLKGKYFLRAKRKLGKKYRVRILKAGIDFRG